MTEHFTTAIANFLSDSWNELLWIAILWVVGHALLTRVATKIVRLVNVDMPDEKREKRAQTLRQVLSATGKTVIYAMIFIIAMGMFGVDTTPFITGAGILGLAVGFGSQALVRDYMSGLLVLYEGQYSVGDQVKIGNFEGVVKKITMRSTVLTGKNGELVYISNGSISNVVNVSQGK